MFDVESEWNHCKNVTILQLVILFHIIEQCLLVTNKEIELKMVVDSFIGCLDIASPEEILTKVLQSIRKLQ